MGHPVHLTRHNLGSAPVVAVVMAVAVAIPIAIAIIAVTATVPAFVAFAVRVLVVPFVAHPVREAAGVFPVIVLELEAASALAVVLAGVQAVTVAVLETVLASFVMPVVVIVI